MSLRPPGVNVSSLLNEPDRSDEEFERAWRAGERSAFAALFRRHYPGLVAYLVRFTGGDRAAAEDLAQQAFVNILQRRRGSGRFKSLVYTTARNLALNERRRQGRRYVAKASLDGIDPPGGPEPVLQRLVRAEERRGFAAALAGLPAEEQEAFALKEMHGMTYAEAGEVMGLHADAVRRRVTKAFAALRQALAPRQEPEETTP